MISLSFFAFPQLSEAANVSSNSCCIYFKPAGPSGQCQVYDPKIDDSVPQTINGNTVETFSCSLYNKTTDRIGDQLFPVINAGLYVHDTNVVGYFQYDTNGIDVPKSCYTVKNYKSEYLPSPLSAYDKNRCEFAANLGTPESIIFGSDFAEAADSFNSQLDKLELQAKVLSTIDAEANNVCCVPKDPATDSCQAGEAVEAKVSGVSSNSVEALQKMLTVLQKPFLANGSTADLEKLDFYSCPSNYKKYPATCSAAIKIARPTELYVGMPETETIGTYCAKKGLLIKEETTAAGVDDLADAGVDDLAELKANRLLAEKELNRIGTTDIRIFLGRAISIAMGIMGSIALAMFVYAGFLFMISGTSDSVEKARSIMVWSSMGIVVVFASYALVQLIFATF